MIDLGIVVNEKGVDLNTRTINAGVTSFLRPEDGAWDPSHPEDFYFVTTNSFSANSRLWRLHFNNLNDLTQGGTATVLLDGSEGQKMMDNITIDKFGHIMIQEDVGNNAHNGKIWQYTIATDELKMICKHDPARFGDIGLSATTPYNQDEESSAIIDAQSILGPGMFLLVDQAHYAIPGDAVEGGQILALYNPDVNAAYRKSLALPAFKSFLDYYLIASPNPTAGIVNLRGNEPFRVLEVISPLGNSLGISRPDATETAIDLSAQPAGAYVIKIYQGNVVKTRTVVKQ
ncbi:MAG: T9SS type A sorting domain-containing protein [Saprospiraceae bacterium]|nr:T9SS type A sorting domain-containing protein [Saprospiraceae bacterium]